MWTKLCLQSMDRYVSTPRATISELAGVLFRMKCETLVPSSYVSIRTSSEAQRGLGVVT